MAFVSLIQPGMSREEFFQIEEHHLASHIGSGSTRVLATPWLIGFMEATSHRLIAQHLSEGYSSVGTQVNVRHLAPTPAGSRVRVEVDVISVEGVRVSLRIRAWDPLEQVGEGTHERVIIDIDRFLKRVAAKQGG